MTPRLSRAILALVTCNATEDAAVERAIKVARDETKAHRAQCNREYTDAFNEAAGL
jgi:hypothetical protein